MPKTMIALRTNFTCLSIRVPKFDYFLEFIKGFYIFKLIWNSIPQKTPFKAWVPCLLQVVVQGSFNKLFLRNLYWIHFFSKRSDMMGGSNWFKDFNTSLAKFCKLLLQILTYLSFCNRFSKSFYVQVEECVYYRTAELAGSI